MTKFKKNISFNSQHFCEIFTAKKINIENIVILFFR